MDQSLFGFSTLLSQAFQQAMYGIVNYLPQVLAAILVLLVGATIASWIKKGMIQLLRTIQFSKVVKDTPIESFLKHADAGKIEDVVGVGTYWLVMLVVIQTTLSLLGLSSLSAMLGQVLAYIPKIVSAIVVLFFGALIAGVVESLVKGALKTISASSARLMGKISSYLVLIVAVMAAIAELRIAQQFIVMLFAGFVGMTALAFGLAFGLGSKDLVRKIIEQWYDELEKELKD